MKNKFSCAVDILSLEIIELEKRRDIENNPLWIIKYNIEIEDLKYAINFLTNSNK